MSHAAVVSAIADGTEKIAADLRVAVPDHWRGRGAGNYQRTAANLGTGVDTFAGRIRELAGLVHRHEIALTAMRAALANGGPVV